MTHDDPHTTDVNPHGGPRPEPMDPGEHRAANLLAVALFFGFFAALGIIVGAALS